MTKHTGQMGGSNAGFGIWVDVNESKHWFNKKTYTNLIETYMYIAI